MIRRVMQQTVLGTVRTRDQNSLASLGQEVGQETLWVT